MLLVQTALLIGFFLTAAAMTNALVGLGSVLLIAGVAYKFDPYTGFLAGFFLVGFVWGNLPLSDGAHDDHSGHAHAPGHDHAGHDHAGHDHASHAGHGHGHGHGHADDNFWDPWGIAYRLVATAIVCAAVTGFVLANSDPAIRVLMVDRAWLSNVCMYVIKGGAGCLALLTLFVVASNWSSAQPQG